MGQLQTHQIRVETEEPNVTVMIGGDGGIPGGFAKFFNRVVDSQAWARLSDAARAVYLPLVRFADQRNQFRVQAGQAALMKYSGLSRSSIKRGVKDLLASKLIVLVEQGGVTADGQNESNVYQLMVPAEGKSPKIGGASTPACSAPGPHSSRGIVDQIAPIPSPTTPGAVSEPTPSPRSNPRGVQPRTPSRFSAEPPVTPLVNPHSVRPEPPAAVHRPGVGRSSAGHALRSNTEPEDISRVPAAHPSRELPINPTPASDAAALLEEKGVEPGVARQLAANYPHERIVDVVATMEYRKARGKCDNPGGFIRDALVRQWQTPVAVVNARKQAEAKLRQQAVEEQARAARTQEIDRADSEERQVERLIESIEDDELSILAESVLKKFQDNPAVLQVLTRKPPRACRLMKFEIAGMLRTGMTKFE